MVYRQTASTTAVVETVHSHPGRTPEYYVGYMESRYTVTSIRAAIRRAIREGKVHVTKSGNERFLSTRKPRSSLRSLLRRE